MGQMLSIAEGYDLINIIIVEPKALFSHDPPIGELIAVALDIADFYSVFQKVISGGLSMRSNVGDFVVFFFWEIVFDARFPVALNCDF